VLKTNLPNWTSCAKGVEHGEAIRFTLPTSKVYASRLRSPVTYNSPSLCRQATLSNTISEAFPLHSSLHHSRFTPCRFRDFKVRSAFTNRDPHNKTTRAQKPLKTMKHIHICFMIHHSLFLLPVTQRRSLLSRDPNQGHVHKLHCQIRQVLRRSRGVKNSEAIRFTLHASRFTLHNPLYAPHFTLTRSPNFTSQPTE
jgi:hypothetical protein